MNLDAVAISKLKLYPVESTQGCPIKTFIFLFWKRFLYVDFCFWLGYDIGKKGAFDDDKKYADLVKDVLEIHPDLNCKRFENVFEALLSLTCGNDEELLKQAIKFQCKLQPVIAEPKPRVNVLVTGSLYVVGLALKVLGFKTVWNCCSLSWPIFLRFFL